MGSPYLIDYRGTFDLPLTPDDAWAFLQRTDLYERWWPWMRDLAVNGDRISPGTDLRFRVVSPLPYRMALRVEIEDVQARRAAALVHGDLEGTGAIVIAPGPRGSTVSLGWTVEIKHPQMRIAARVARPLLRWGQTWAIQSALRGFLRHVGDQSPPATY
jgi:carbon monoxide dehydrogenase subunit G